MDESIVLSFIPAEGFLGTGATFVADCNLMVQAVMEVALIAGVVLAKQERAIQQRRWNLLRL